MVRGKRKKQLEIIISIALVLLTITSALFAHGKTAGNMETQLTLENLPTRTGDRPNTTNTNPHTQLNQQPQDLTYINNLQQWAFQLSKIDKRHSLVSVPGAMAMFMDQEHACTSCNAFMASTEFAHFHPHPDYSMHLGLPQEDAKTIIKKGWGEWHPLIQRGILPPNIVMVYAPRNQEELEATQAILQRSYDYAKRN